MRPRSLATAASAGVAALVAGFFLMPSASAASAPKDTTEPALSGVVIAPRTVVLQQSGKARLTVSVTATDDTRVAMVLGMLYVGTDPYKATTGDMLDDFTQVPGTNTWTSSTTLDRTQATGRYSVAVAAFDSAANYAESNAPNSVHVQRATRMATFDGGPARVSAGSPVTTSGRLTRLGARGYVGFAGQKVKVYFQPAGGSFAYQGTVVTDRFGRWSRTSVATVDGTWQARYSGDADHAARHSARDFVDVR